MVTQNKSQLHMTIGSHPVAQINLEQDLRLVKAAILYADRVKLYSPTYSMLCMVAKLENIPPDQHIQLIQMVMPYIASPSDAERTSAFLKVYKEKFQNNRLTEVDVAVQKMLEKSWVVVKETAHKIVDGTGFNELNQLTQSGLLEIHPFKQSTNDNSVLQFLTDCIALASGSPKLPANKFEMTARNNAMVKEFIDGISNSVSNGSTYPLFDLETGNLVRLGIREGVISVSDAAITRGKHSGLAGKLFERLPLFEEASLKEILDIRTELEKYLVRYRQALIRFSENIRAASWDKDFPLEAENVFIRDVAPTIIDIEDAAKTNKYLISLLKKFTVNPLVLPSGAVLSMIMSQFSALPDEVVMGLGLAATTTGAALIYSAYDEWRLDRQKIEQNNLYFYYRTGKKLQGYR
jgi:hypothetical protein